MLISQAPSRLLTGETIALNSNQLMNEKTANWNHGVTGEPLEVTSSLSNSDCVTWCSENLKMKTTGPSTEFATMSIITLMLGQETCPSCFQATSLSSACSLNKWFGLNNSADNGIWGLKVEKIDLWKEKLKLWLINKKITSKNISSRHFHRIHWCRHSCRLYQLQQHVACTGTNHA